ncbi:MAG: integration host factor subunit beta [Prevotella sp.]|nr:integration host factor subunit beta [Prevotella sp.]
MTKAELIAEIVDRTGIERAEVSGVVEAFMSLVKECVLDGQDAVYLRGFGTFALKHRAAKTGRNISKNITIDIPDRYVPYFKPAKDFVKKAAERRDGHSL